MAEDGYVSFDGLDLAEVILALYHGTAPLGMGYLHNKPGLTLDDVRGELAELKKDNNGNVWIDYYHGRPLKLKPLDLAGKRFFARLYDRDAGQGAAQAIVDRLRKNR